MVLFLSTILSGLSIATSILSMLKKLVLTYLSFLLNLVLKKDHSQRWCLAIIVQKILSIQVSEAVITCICNLCKSIVTSHGTSGLIRLTVTVRAT